MTTPQELFNSKSLESLGSSATFSFRAKDNGLFKADQIIEALKINLDTAKFESTIQLKSLSKVTALSNNTFKPKQISNQILAEPLKAFSTDVLVNDKLGSNSTIASNIVSQTQETIDRLSSLSQKPDQINNKDITSCLKAAGKKCATISELEVKQADFANGHIIHTGAVSTTVSGNGVNIHSDTSLTTRSPYIQTNTQDFHVQANNSAVILSDLEIRQSKQALNLVEGTSIQQNQVSLQVSSDTQDSIAKQYRSVGTESHTSMGTNTQVIADNQLTHLSGGNIQSAAYKSISTQAAEDISFIASPSGKLLDIKPHAEGEIDIPILKTSSITMVSSNGVDKTNIIQLSEAGSLNSTTGNSITAASKGAILSGQEGVASISSSFAYIGSQVGGLIVKNRRIYVNSVPPLIQPIIPPTILQLPKLPTIPQISKTDLSKCLPASLKNKPKDSNTNSSSSSEGNSSTQNTSSSSIPAKPTLSSKPIANPKQSARVLDKPGTLSNPVESKLPGSSISQSAVNSSNQNQALIGNSPNAALDSSGSSGASFNIYLDCAQDKSNIFKFISSLDFTDASEYKISDSVLITALTEEALMQFSKISDDLIKSKLGDLIPAEALPAFQDLEVWKTFSKLNQNKISEKSLNQIKDPNLNVDKVKKLISTYPNTVSTLQEILDYLYSTAALGFFGALSGLFSSLKLPIGLIERGIQIPSIIASGDIYKTIQLGAGIISQVTGNSTFSNLINNSDILSIGSALFTQDSGKLNQSINTIIKSKINSILPTNLQVYGDAIESVINKIQIGKPIKEEEIIPLLTNGLGSLNNSSINSVLVAKDIYDKASPIFQDIAKGNLSNLLTGKDLPNLLGSLGSVGSQISNVVNVVNQAVGIVDTVKLIPDLLKLMNDYKIPALNQIGIAISCLDLFNKVSKLLNSLKGFNEKSSNKDTTRLLESAGRLTQGLNSIKNLNPSQTNEDLNSFIRETQNLEIPIDLDPCFKVPKLTIEQSNIKVNSFEFLELNFSLTNIELLDLEYLPGQGETIQLRIESFIDNQSGEFLQAFQTEFQYTPSIYNFTISEFNYSLNQGVAFLNRDFSEVILQASSGVLYEYSTSLIGSQLNPFIVDAYLLS